VRRERTRKGLLRKDPNADGVEDLLSFQSENGKPILDLIDAGAGDAVWFEFPCGQMRSKDPNRRAKLLHKQHIDEQLKWMCRAC
jgi:hypothetical protein